MYIDQLVNQIKNSPDQVEFNEVINVIDEYYQYTPTKFCNGIEKNRIINNAGENEGSCKIFAFALLNKLNKDETLACFGQYYRTEVLQNLDKDNHPNIRNFMLYGWQGIDFSSEALQLIKL